MRVAFTPFVVALLDGQRPRTGRSLGLTFTNLTLAASSVAGERDILWGSQVAPIRNLTFNHFTIAGDPIVDASHFVTNANVSGLVFH